MRIRFFYAIIVSFVFFSLSISAQEETLQVNQPTKFILKDKEQKVLHLNLKKGDFTEIKWEDSTNNYPKFTLISPNGKNLSEQYFIDDSMPFVANEEGQYKVIFESGDSDDKSDTEITIKYINVFQLPKTAQLKRQKKINGYDIKVYNNASEDSDYGSYLLIQKDGKLVEILKNDSLVGDGLHFADNPADFYDAKGKTSARLIRTTLDKTGDGTQDIVVQSYSGGAHCCTSWYFYELGKNGVRKINVINGGDSDILAIRKNPKAGLVLQTGDSTFAYWLTSFAGSPIPTVILTFKNGEFRPDAKLMKKPAPSLNVLKQKAAKAKKEISLNPYKGEDSEDFMFAFWGEMLDLMYAGNEKTTWEYLDLVWDSRKEGKEKFKEDFLKRLNESKFWQMLEEDRK